MPWKDRLQIHDLSFLQDIKPRQRKINRKRSTTFNDLLSFVEYLGKQCEKKEGSISAPVGSATGLREDAEGGQGLERREHLAAQCCRGE